MATPGVGPEERRIRDLLEQRTARLRQRPSGVDEDEPFLVAELSLGGSLYGLPLGDLRGVVPVRHVVPVPLAPPYVLGVIRFRGEMVTALSLAWLLNAAGWRRDPSVLLVVASGGNRKLAFDCEEVPKPVALRGRSWGERALDLERTDVPATTEIEEGDRRLRLVDIARLLDQRLGDASRGEG